MKCLNCETDVEGNFCSHCGQKTSTHRFSLKELFSNGFLTGVFMVNKRFFYTLQTLFTRPGHGIRDYIQGRRVLYFNAFSFLLIIIAIAYFIDEFTDLKLADVMMDKNSKDFADAIEQFSEAYPRLVHLMNIPIMAICSYVFFRKSKLNLAEHIIMNTYIVSAHLILMLPLMLLTVFYKDTEVLSVIYQLHTLIIIIGYMFWFYGQFFSVNDYKKSSLIFRSFAVVLLIYILQGITLASIVGIRNMV